MYFIIHLWFGFVSGPVSCCSNFSIRPYNLHFYLYFGVLCTIWVVDFFDQRSSPSARFPTGRLCLLKLPVLFLCYGYYTASTESRRGTGPSCYYGHFSMVRIILLLVFSWFKFSLFNGRVLISVLFVFHFGNRRCFVFSLCTWKEGLYYVLSYTRGINKVEQTNKLMVTSSLLFTRHFRHEKVVWGWILFI